MTTPALLVRRSAPETDATASALARIEAKIDALRLEIARLSRRPVDVDLADREWLAEFLPAVSAAVGDEEWTLPTLAALSLLPDFGSLVPSLARPGGFLSMGKALGRCAGHTIAGYTLFRVKRSRDGTVWRVKR